MCHTSSRYKIWTGKCSDALCHLGQFTRFRRAMVDKWREFERLFTSQSKQVVVGNFAGLLCTKWSRSKRRIRQIRAFWLFLYVCLVMYNVYVSVWHFTEHRVFRFSIRGQCFFHFGLNCECVCVCVFLCLCDCKSRWFIVSVFLGYSFFVQQ